MQDKIVDTLCVYWEESLVGRYQRFESGSEQFVYDYKYINSPSARAISHSLPLCESPYSRPQLRPFFGGLLPEESQRDQIASYLGLNRTDDFALLKALGGECAGALTILPEDVSPATPSSQFDILSEEALSKILESLPMRPTS